MDSVRLSREQPELQSILETGLKWPLISHEVEVQWPKLPHLIQKALNVDHHIGEGESWDEQFAQVVNAVVDGLRQDGSKLDWGKVTRQVLSSEPPRAQDIAAQVAFCKVWGVGKKQTFAMDALAYIQRKCSDSIVGGPIFDKLATLSLPPQNMCPYLVTAVLNDTAHDRLRAEHAFRFRACGILAAALRVGIPQSR